MRVQPDAASEALELGVELMEEACSQHRAVVSVAPSRRPALDLTYIKHTVFHVLLSTPRPLMLPQAARAERLH